jgi:hypothetical protein
VLRLLIALYAHLYIKLCPAAHAAALLDCNYRNGYPIVCGKLRTGNFAGLGQGSLAKYVP